MQLTRPITEINIRIYKYTPSTGSHTVQQ